MHVNSPFRNISIHADPGRVDAAAGEMPSISMRHIDVSVPSNAARTPSLIKCNKYVYCESPWPPRWYLRASQHIVAAVCRRISVSSVPRLVLQSGWTAAARGDGHGCLSIGRHRRQAAAAPVRAQGLLDT